MDTTSINQGGLGVSRGDAAKDSLHSDASQLTDILKDITSNAMGRFEKANETSKNTDIKQVAADCSLDFVVKDSKINTFI